MLFMVSFLSRSASESGFKQTRMNLGWPDCKYIAESDDGILGEVILRRVSTRS